MQVPFCIHSMTSMTWLSIPPCILCLPLAISDLYCSHPAAFLCHSLGCTLCPKMNVMVIVDIPVLIQMANRSMEMGASPLDPVCSQVEYLLFAEFVGQERTFSSLPVITSFRTLWQSRVKAFANPPCHRSGYARAMVSTRF